MTNYPGKLYVDNVYSAVDGVFLLMFIKHPGSQHNESDKAATVERRLLRVNSNTKDAADDIVRLYTKIRGYGPVKEEAIGKLGDEISGRLNDYVQQ